MDIIVHATQFTRRNCYGDFLSMIKKDIRQRNMSTLYIYNDNVEAQIRKHTVSSGGNACIREFNMYNPEYPKPFSAGICTGSRTHGGFKSLTPENISIIDEGFARIDFIIRQHNIKHIYYSTDNENGLLGMSIFKVGLDVREYITEKLGNYSMYELSIEYQG